MSGGKDEDGKPKPDLHQLRTLSEIGHPEAAAGRLSTGQMFGQRYTIEEAIGAGGSGVVYRAMDRLTRKVIALKLLGAQRGAEALERLLAEALIARDIRHPNVVAVYDVGAYEGRPFIIMEHLSGQTLRRWMNERLSADADIPYALVREIMLAVIDGLEAAHKQNVVHRDLKPENIFLVGEPEEGRVRLKLLDFGLARLVGGGGLSSATTTGTPYYMAPEQITAPDTVKPSADFFSLSVLFYELLVGVLPQGYWQAPSRGRSDVPETVDKLIEAGLSNRPRMRPQSANEFRAGLLGTSADPPAAPAPAPAAPSQQTEAAPQIGEQYRRMGDAAYETAALKQPEDQSKALPLYEEGARLGNIACMLRVAELVLRGADAGVKEDQTAGLLWLERAMDAGSEEGREQLDLWTGALTAFEPEGVSNEGHGLNLLLATAGKVQAASERLFAKGEKDLAGYFWWWALDMFDHAAASGSEKARKARAAYWPSEFGKNFAAEDEDE